MTRSRARIPVLILLLATVVLSIPAGLMLFSAFQEYDDAGYVLNSIKTFVDRGGLYRDVYSQYGPFCYVLYYVAHYFGLPINHDVGFLFRLVEWSGAAFFSARLVWKGTENLACAIACLSGVFVFLWLMIGEPIHPGGTIAFFTAVLAGLGYDALRSERLSRWAVVAGMGVAVLALTKINIGIFALMAAGTVWLLFLQSDRIRSFAPWIVALCFGIFPFALMHALLGVRGVEMFAVLFALSAIPMVGAAARGAVGRFRATHVAVASLAGTTVSAIVVAVVLARGSDFGDLLHGIILRPLQQPGRFASEFNWNVAALPVAIASLGCFLSALLCGRRTFPSLERRELARASTAPASWLPTKNDFDDEGASIRRYVDVGVSILRLVAVAGLAVALLQFPRFSPDHLVMPFFGPCLWLFLWPLGNERPEKTLARAWLGFFLLGQWLHAYPVAGSQIGWGTFLVVPLGILGAWEAVRWLISQTRSEKFVVGEGVLAEVSQPARECIEGARLTGEPEKLGQVDPPRQATENLKWLRRGRIATNFGLVGFSVFMGFQLAKIGARYFESRSLGLPGAELLRLPDTSTGKYRVMCLNAVAHADVLFSFPGMFSYNVWTGIPAPTHANVTHWYEMLTDDEQSAILRSLQVHERSCVIVSNAALQFMRRYGRIPSGKLVDYIMNEYVPAFSIDENEFRVRRGRRIAAFDTATLYAYQGTAKGESYDLQLQMCLLLPAGSQIASIEISPMDASAGPTTSIRGDKCRVEITPINLNGDTVGASVANRLPFSLERPSLVEVYFRRNGPLLPAALSWVVLRDANGEEVALVRFIKPNHQAEQTK